MKVIDVTEGEKYKIDEEFEIIFSKINRLYINLNNDYFFITDNVFGEYKIKIEEIDNLIKALNILKEVIEKNG